MTFSFLDTRFACETHDHINEYYENENESWRNTNPKRNGFKLFRFIFGLALSPRKDSILLTTGKQ